MRPRTSRNLASQATRDAPREHNNIDLHVLQRVGPTSKRRVSTGGQAIREPEPGGQRTASTYRSADLLMWMCYRTKPRQSQEREQLLVMRARTSSRPFARLGAAPAPKAFFLEPVSAPAGKTSRDGPGGETTASYRFPAARPRLQATPRARPRLVARSAMARSVSTAVSSSRGQRREARGDQRRLVDRHAVVLVEVAAKPAGGDARMPARILARDQQRQVESLGQADPADLLRGRFGDEQVAALERSTKDRPRVALRGRRSSSPWGRAARRGYAKRRGRAERPCAALTVRWF
jgi:hypothetical protein